MYRSLIRPVVANTLACPHSPISGLGSTRIGEIPGMLLARVVDVHTIEGLREGDGRLSFGCGPCVAGDGNGGVVGGALAFGTHCDHFEVEGLDVGNMRRCTEFVWYVVVVELWSGEKEEW
jgi:hypothetical protein